MLEVQLKLGKKTRDLLTKKLQKYRDVITSNSEYEAGQVRNYVSLIARAAYNLGQKDIKLPAQEEGGE